MQYRRANTKGGTYFFTVNLAERNKTLLTDHIDDLRNAFKNVKATHPMIIDAIVVLPDHLHAIWTLPGNDADFSTRWRLIKSCFSQSVPRIERVTSSRKSKGERGVWQRRFWEHQIRDDADYQAHMDYIYYNPVKHGYVKNVVEWPYSSFHRDLNKGKYTKFWGGDTEIEFRAGELE
ncbi:REP-associated tyrosine transposase [Aliikangiella coralliicola]|uniref:Transposase n=1 Tax=Aliikangiella coralliicola TaxID=2592383 RepID=A0A545UB87_9GAMM|nr:transposase [Aliikangiella coralliicola]TQV86731.1 transposase [Aliikangiella coralliicola]